MSEDHDQSSVECLNRESLLGVIGIHVPAILSIKEHLELQIILVERAPLLYSIHLADMREECHCSSLRTVPDHRRPVLTQMSTKPSSKS